MRNKYNENLAILGFILTGAVLVVMIFLSLYSIVRGKEIDIYKKYYDRQGQEVKYDGRTQFLRY